MPILFVIFIIVPIVEISIFMKAGDLIGIGPTLMMIILTAVIGVSLLRQQGLSTLYKAQQRMNHGEIPAMEMIEGIMLAVAGALLITPGFFTDIIGFLLLIPTFRLILFSKVLQNKVQMFTQNNQSTHTDQQYHSTTNQSKIIEGEFKNTDDDT